MNEELMKKLANVDTVEELNALLAENNIELEDGLTPEAFLETLKASDEELDADALDDVAGGSQFSLTIIKRIVKGIVLILRQYRWK